MCNQIFINLTFKAEDNVHIQFLFYITKSCIFRCIFRLIFQYNCIYYCIQKSPYCSIKIKNAKQIVLYLSRDMFFYYYKYYLYIDIYHIYLSIKRILKCHYFLKTTAIFYSITTPCCMFNLTIIFLNSNIHKHQFHEKMHRRFITYRK